MPKSYSAFGLNTLNLDIFKAQIGLLSENKIIDKTTCNGCGKVFLNTNNKPSAGLDKLNGKIGNRR